MLALPNRIDYSEQFKATIVAKHIAQTNIDKWGRNDRLTETNTEPE